MVGLEWQKPAAVDSVTLQDYVGRYEYEAWPGYIDTVTRKGLQLYVQSTGDKEATPLNAATPNAFYLTGEPIFIVFTRGRDGLVSGIGANWPGGEWREGRKMR